MEAVRENARMSQTVLDKSIECNVEANVIVPDKNPDILKVLQVDTTAAVTKKVLKEGRLTVEGRVYADVIYLSDGEEAKLKTLPAVIEFSDFFDLALLNSGMHSFVSCDIESAELNLINSRKINLRVKLEINAEVIADTDADYITAVNGDDVAYKCEEFEGFSIVLDDNIEFLIKEETELPSSCAPICDIIKCDASISDKEVRVSGTKAIVKGAVTAAVLYTDSDGKIEMTNAHFPFTEVFEAGDDIDESKLCATCQIIEKVCEIGGERSIRYEFLLRIEVNAKKGEHLNVMSDCYFYHCNTISECEEVYFETARKLLPTVRSVREIIMADEHLPKINTVYNVVAKPRIVSSEKLGDGIAVNVVLGIMILYLSESKENPICCLKADIPLSHKIDGAELTDVTLVAECEHISYALTSGGDVEIRASVVLSGEDKTKKKCLMITNVEKGEEEAGNEIIIFFASGGEDLWDVAKRYRVDADYIAKLNEIDKDKKLQKGKKMIIPV